MKSSSFLLIGVFLFSSFANAAGDISCEKFAEQLKAKGILDENDPKLEKPNEGDYRNLMELLKSRLSELEAEKENGNEDDEYDTKEEFLTYAIENIEESIDGSERQIYNGYMVGLRFLYTVCSLDFVGKKTGLAEKFKKIGRFIRGNFKSELVKDKNSRVDGEDEALFLHKVEDDSIWKSEELDGMSIQQVAGLDISPSHPVWHTKGKIKELDRVDAWEQLEEYANRAVTKRLIKKDVISEGEKFDIKTAPRVLFIDELKMTATSPKIKARDAYGLKWKLKWGNEAQTEPVANRLWVYLGGKFADFTYMNAPGTQGSVLILDDKNEPEDDVERPEDYGSMKVEEREFFDNCLAKKIRTVKKFKDCMLAHPVYNFLMDPYVLEEGTLDSSNIDRILENGVHISSSQKASLKGRDFLTFKTSMVEFSGKGFVERGGPTAFSSAGATKDRVARGLGAFNAWLNNTDAKDENNKVFIMKLVDQRGKTIEKVPVETQHDLGNSFGDFALGYPNAGDLNSYVATDFVKVRRNKAIFQERMLYLPRAWTVATTADSLWMVGKMAAFTEEKAKKAIAASKWPDFIQSVFLYKLMSRRNHIADAYGVEVVDRSSAEVPQIVPVELTTVEQRETAAKKYRIPLDRLNDYLIRKGYLESPQVPAKKRIRDWVVDNSNGQIASCKDSIIISLLENYVYPAGLSKRILRNKDNEPLHPKGCEPKELD